MRPCLGILNESVAAQALLPFFLTFFSLLQAPFSKLGLGVRVVFYLEGWDGPEGGQGLCIAKRDNALSLIR